MGGGQDQAASRPAVTLSIFFLPDAEADLLEAQAWYDGRAFGLGSRFFDAVESTLMRMVGAPQQFPTVHGDIHRALVRRFPYALYFRIEQDGVYVLACTHTSRALERWRGRA
jgi:plasmid stabilization system protein ParE